MTPTPEMRMFAMNALFWLAMMTFVAHVVVRVKNERIQRTLADRDERDFWFLLRARTLVAAIVTSGGAMLAMLAN